MPHGAGACVEIEKSPVFRLFSEKRGRFLILSIFTIASGGPPRAAASAHSLEESVSRPTRLSKIMTFAAISDKRIDFFYWAAEYGPGSEAAEKVVHIFLRHSGSRKHGIYDFLLFSSEGITAQ